MMETKYPDYDNCLINVSNSILHYYNLPTYHSTLPELDKLLNKQYKNVVLLLYDGLGSLLLNDKLPHSFLMQNKLKDITSVFPATTTAATTSIISGLSPMEHCWLGWDIYVAAIEKTVTMYRNVEKNTGFPIMTDDLCKKNFLLSQSLRE